METRILWFETWHQAAAFSRRWGLGQAPEKRPVWLDLAWRDEWSLIVPIAWKTPLMNNEQAN